MKSELTQKHYDEIVIERLDGDDLSVRFFADGRSISDYCITEWQLKAAVKSINIDADNFDRSLGGYLTQFKRLFEQMICDHKIRRGVHLEISEDKDGLYDINLDIKQ